MGEFGEPRFHRSLGRQKVELVAAISESRPIAPPMMPHARATAIAHIARRCRDDGLR